MNEAYRNFPSGFAGKTLKTLLFPIGNHFKLPSDDVTLRIANKLMVPGEMRDRLTHLCYVGAAEGDNVGLMDRAFVAMYGVRDLEKKLLAGVKAGKVARKGLLADRLAQALKENILSQEEVDKILEADALRYRAIQVDHFSHDMKTTLTNGDPQKQKALANAS